MIHSLELFINPKWTNISSSVFRLLGEIKKKDHYYLGHVTRACSYAVGFGHEQGLNEKELRLLYLATFFHDIGKIMVPAAIINKSGSLDPEERDVMNTHPTIGEKICLELGPLEEVAEFVACHHERPNGQGYPRGLKARETPELARILAVVEVYDALRSKRSYKESLSQEQSLEILYQSGASGNLDKLVVDQFVRFARNKDAGRSAAEKIVHQGIVFS